jgi:hypothetical protein
MRRDRTMSDDVAFEAFCLMLNHDPKSTTWEEVVTDVIKMTEFVSMMSSAAVMKQLPTDLLVQMRDVIS